MHTREPLAMTIAQLLGVMTSHLMPGRRTRKRVSEP
jgi:hypothetical protein